MFASFFILLFTGVNTGKLTKDTSLFILKQK
jgi:hypothetical protein